MKIDERIQRAIDKIKQDAIFKPKYIVLDQDHYADFIRRTYEITGKLDAPSEYSGLPIVVVKANILEVVTSPETMFRDWERRVNHANRD